MSTPVPPRPGLGRMPQPALGRIVIPDIKDLKFPLRAALPETLPPLKQQRSWEVQWIGDQGDTSQCVGYAWHSFLRAAPQRRRKTSIPAPAAMYQGAQQHDDWPGESPAYEGSSVRGGAKYVSEILGGLVEYRWASTVEEIIAWLNTKGPVVMGTNWYRDMFIPRGPHAWVGVDGEQDGGHAYLCYGFENKGATLKFANSWGRKWGEFGGRFRMTSSVVRRLLAEDGEACVAIKKKVS